MAMSWWVAIMHVCWLHQLQCWMSELQCKLHCTAASVCVPFQVLCKARFVGPISGVPALWQSYIWVCAGFLSCNVLTSASTGLLI